MNYFNYHKKYFKQAGFTLIELMVSLALFSIIVLAVVGALYSVNEASRKTQAMGNVLSNLNFAVEAMSRTIRTSTNLVCGGNSNLSENHDCPFNNDITKINIGSAGSVSTTNGSSAISMESTLGGSKNIEYLWGENSDGSGNIERVTDSVGNQTTEPVSLTSPEINITNLKFYVNGASSVDNKQPSVMIFVEGVATTPDGSIAPFAIQTYVSQRAQNQ